MLSSGRKTSLVRIGPISVFMAFCVSLAWVTASRAQNAEWFPTDVDVDGGGRTPTLMILYIHAVESVPIQIAYDGATYVALTPNPTADAVTKYVIPMKTADVINFRTTDAGGINIRNGKLVSIFDDVD